MTIIANLRHHFNARAMEWGLAGWATSWGMKGLLEPEILYKDYFAGLMQIGSFFSPSHPATFVALVVMLTGLTRLTALFINGTWQQTPLIRLITSAVSAFVIMSIVVGLSIKEPSMGPTTYFWLFLADCWCAKRAGEDWGQVLRTKQQLKHITA